MHLGSSNLPPRVYVTLKIFGKLNKLINIIILERGIFLINNRRGELEILIDILNLASRGVKKTEILYQVNLSYSQLKNYLSFLTERDFVREERDNNEHTYKIFRITVKGEELLNMLNQVVSYLK